MVALIYFHATIVKTLKWKFYYALLNSIAQIPLVISRVLNSIVLFIFPIPRINNTKNNTIQYWPNSNWKQFKTENDTNSKTEMSRYLC